MMMIHPVIDVDIKSPAPSHKQPIQQRLEKRQRPASAKTDREEIAENIADANRRHQAFLQSRIQRSRAQYEQAKAMSANKDKAVKELADQLSRDLQSRLVRAESNREILFNASLAKTKTFNHRVSEAQKKKEEIDNADLNKSVTEDLQLRLSSADLRRSLALEEFKEKASNDCAKVKAVSESLKAARADSQKLAFAEISARQQAALSRREHMIEELKSKAAEEVNKAKEALAKKEQAKAALEAKMKERQNAAIDRRTAMMADHRDKAASAVSRAKEVAAEQAKKEIKEREKLLMQIETRHEEAERRRLTSASSSTVKK